MNVKMTEGLTVNGVAVQLGETELFVNNEGTSISRAYAALATGAQPIVDNFSEMILGVANAPQLSTEQKDYIIEMLEDQLNTELQCAVMTQG